MSNAPVDVLAVMHKAGISLTIYPTSGPKPSDQLREARAAVAELLEAAKALESKSMQRTKLTASVYNKHIMRLRAALARCKGGAA